LPSNVRAQPPYERHSVSRSAARALDILEHFATAARPLRAVEIEQALGLNRSTTVQILKTLVDAGHVMFRAGDKVYMPSPRLIGFGTWIAGCYFGDDRISRILNTLCERTAEYVALFAQNDVYMQVIDLRSPAGQPPRAQLGVKVPLFGSACGAAMVARHPDGMLHELMDRARIAPSDRREILQALSVVRSDGYAYGGVSPDDDTRAIIMPLPTPASAFPLVFGIGGPTERIEQRRFELVAEMRAALAEVFGE
jgi:DNA-binding IclR family transcriptional regulator